MKKTALLLSALSLFVFAPAPAIAAGPDGGKAITGTVTIAPALKGKIGQTAALYIIARPNGVNAGPPVAVKRFASPLTLPARFEMSGKDAMMPDTPFVGEFTLIARVSQSGSAMPSPGDFESSKPLNGIKPGGKPVSLMIDEERK